MSIFRFLKVVSCSLAFTAALASADAIDVETVARGGFWMRDDQLREVGDQLLYGNSSFIDLGFNYLPLPTQVPLRSKFGEHEGFAVRHHFAGASSFEISKKNYLTALLWFERSGWDSEDFFFFPHYGDFGLVRSVTTWGMGYTNANMGYSIAAGMQHQNVEYVGEVFPAENDSLLYSWVNLRYGRVSAQAQFHRTHLGLVRLSLDLEDRAVYGGASSGIWTYLPNVDVTFYKRNLDGSDEDFVRLNWEQNLIAQRLYLELTYDFPDDGFHSAALKYYPDPSRLAGIELTCVRRRAIADDWDDLMFGWALELPVVRVGYNAAYEYDHLFQAKGTWFVEFQFNLQSVGDMMFARTGRQNFPLETTQKKRKNTPDKASTTIPLTGNSNASDGPTKTITAKGIRYENSATQGGK